MNEDRARKRRRLRPPESGPYVLQKVLEDIPLSADNESPGISITCVEFWSDNLYIGTSASEILHLVRLPPETEHEPAQYILASRLQPSGHDADSGNVPAGVQQILLLPGVLKACVLCNGTASFYSLPELSPAFPSRELTGVQWLGGYDENEGRNGSESTSMMIATARNILRVQVGDKLKPIRPNIGYPDCLKASRRDTIACVADSRSYALLEIEHQQKIPLFDISTAPDIAPPSSSLAPPQAAGHARSKSLGDVSPDSIERTRSPDKANLQPPELPGRTSSPAQGAVDSRSGSRPRSSTAETNQAPGVTQRLSRKRLKPQVLSPIANEFMLTTGTTPNEPGVGMFMNTDGDVSRGTIGFDQYPDAVISCSFNTAAGFAEDEPQHHLIVAMFDRSSTSQTVRGIQVQGIVAEDEGGPRKAWVVVEQSEQPLESVRAGLHKSIDAHHHSFVQVADILRAVRYKPGRNSPALRESDPRTRSSIERLEQESALFDTTSNGSTSPTPEYEAQRASEELKFVQGLGRAVTHAMVWSNGNLWHLLPNPLLLQFESQIAQAIDISEQGYNFNQVNVPQLLSLLGSIRDYEPQDETEFLSIKYARQKASIVILLHLLTGLRENPNLKAACKLAESALLEGEVDPRLVLTILGPLSREVLFGGSGLWVSQGIVDCFDDFETPVYTFKDTPTEFWLMIRHFLSTWQDKRGASGSLGDENSIFNSVDAALLRVLLFLDDSDGTSGDGQTPTRLKLNNVVDHWKGDFDRAVTLLEHHKRLFVLSRLYQSKKSSKDVLNTWKRICAGEENRDHNVSPDLIYQQMRRYLPLLRDSALVQEYAVWLAQRSPDLAVQVLSDDGARIKFAPAEVVTLLKANAPGAVQLFLEHLVFNKNLDQYADDLVGYYLDSVLNVLEHSEEARQALADSYTAYRAMTPPKPTYLNFITENAPTEPWWQSRLRLLQLLGTGGYATETGQAKTLTYSIALVLDRLKPFDKYLVSESIILDARQGRHNEALKLLVHGLGDYDTAVRYCYFGGPTSPTGTIDASMLPSREQQQEQFYVLFKEFLQIEDVEERIDRTSHLLGTFATWFDPLTILDTIPSTWSVSLLSEFLLRTFRAATTERAQAILIKALSAAQNLQKQAEFIDTCEKLGAKLELDEGAPDTATDNQITIS